LQPVLLIVDVPFYRDGLQRLLSQDEAFMVVGAVSSEEAVAAATRENPALVLLDISPPDARRRLQQLLALSPAPRVVAMAVEETHESIVGWIEAGIAGYVTRNATSSELIQALRIEDRRSVWLLPRAPPAIRAHRARGGA